MLSSGWGKKRWVNRVMLLLSGNGISLYPKALHPHPHNLIMTVRNLRPSTCRDLVNAERPDLLPDSGIRQLTA